MSDTHQVPPDVTASGDRVQERDYDSAFARFPRSEVDVRTGPGGAPRREVHGDRPNVAMLIMAAGAVLTFGVFFITTPILLVLGLLLILGGAVMTIFIHHRPGRRSGLGYSQVSDAPPAGSRR